MLVEFTTKYGGESRWVNPEYVVTVEQIAEDASALFFAVKAEFFTDNGYICVLGTPAAVAAKLNGEAK